MTGRILIGETIVTAARLVIDRRGELFRVGLVLILGIFAIGVFALNYVLPLLQMQVPQVGGAAPASPCSIPASSRRCFSCWWWSSCSSRSSPSAGIA